MPKERVFEDLVPRADAWQRRIHQDKASHPSRILSGERITHHVADIVGDKIGPLDAERVEQTGHVAALGLLVVPAVRS
jgi:hypothetical protein